MAENRGRLQESIDEWRSKAEKELGVAEKAEMPGNSEDKQKFKLNIPGFDDEIRDRPGESSAEKETIIDHNQPSADDEEARPFAGSVRNFTYSPEEEQDDEETETEAEDIRRLYDLSCAKLKAGGWELFIGGLLMLALILVDFSACAGIHLPSMIDWQETPFNFIFLNLSLLFTEGIIFYKQAIGGVVKIFRMKADGDSLSSIAFLSAMIAGAYLLFAPWLVASGRIYLVAACAGACLFGNAIGEELNLARVRDNLGFVLDGGYSREIRQVSDFDSANILTGGLGLPDPVIAFSRKAETVSGFYKNTTSPSCFDRFAYVACPLVIIAAALCFVFVYLGKGLPQAFFMLTAICSIGAPVTGQLGSHLPMWRASRKFSKLRAAAAGYSAAVDLSETNAMVFSDTELFPEGSVTIHSIKPMVKGRGADDAILDAASLICAAGGVISGQFKKIIYGNTDILRSVQGFEYDGQNGICGWVENRRVLLGNRDLMLRYGLQLPLRSSEAKYAAEGLGVLYLAVGGELSAILFVSYSAENQHLIRKLRKFGISMLVNTRDPNISASMLGEKFRLPGKNIKILSERETPVLEHLSQEDPDTVFLYDGDIRAYIQSVITSIKLRGTVFVSAVLQAVGMAMGIAIMAYIAATGDISRVTPVQLLLYQAIWTVPVLAIAAFRKF